ncbi:uncharacterized protein BJ171DRAFT_516593, partial [Polychytrium aggregatum]|uniref:uncharacterized protein n=1 Tax=Polychytrium aggregatum TaxID=110093 RepID=UPI0022FECC0B
MADEREPATEEHDMESTVFAALIRSLGIPLDCVVVILFDNFATLIAPTEGNLRLKDAMGCKLGIQLECLAAVLWDSTATEEALSQVKLGHGVVSVSRCFVKSGNFLFSGHQLGPIDFGLVDLQDPSQEIRSNSASLVCLDNEPGSIGSLLTVIVLREGNPVARCEADSHLSVWIAQTCLSTPVVEARQRRAQERSGSVADEEQGLDCEMIEGTLEALVEADNREEVRIQKTRLYCIKHRWDCAKQL